LICKRRNGVVSGGVVAMAELDAGKGKKFATADALFDDLGI
jgi:hypothetical protein